MTFRILLAVKKILNFTDRGFIRRNSSENQTLYQIQKVRGLLWTDFNLVCSLIYAYKSDVQIFAEKVNLLIRNGPIRNN